MAKANPLRWQPLKGVAASDVDVRASMIFSKEVAFYLVHSRTPWMCCQTENAVSLCGQLPINIAVKTTCSLTMQRELRVGFVFASVKGMTRRDACISDRFMDYAVVSELALLCPTDYSRCFCETVFEFQR